MMPITAKVQNQADGNTAQPNSSRSVNTAAIRLRRRLSNIFQRDRSESGFLLRRASRMGISGNSQRAICQSPRIQRCRRLTSAL